jgi:hypothetical protein
MPKTNKREKKPTNLTKNATKYSIWERLWIALYKKKRQTNIKLMTNTKTVEQKENEYGQNKMNSFYLNRQSGFVLKYRNCTHLPSWIR